MPAIMVFPTSQASLFLRHEAEKFGGAGFVPEGLRPKGAKLLFWHYLSNIFLQHTNIQEKESLNARGSSERLIYYLCVRFDRVARVVTAGA